MVASDFVSWRKPLIFKFYCKIIPNSNESPRKPILPMSIKVPPPRYKAKHNIPIWCHASVCSMFNSTTYRRHSQHLSPLVLCQAHLSLTISQTNRLATSRLRNEAIPL